jgi:hypothetical protein
MKNIFTLALVALTLTCTLNAATPQHQVHAPPPVKFITITMADTITVNCNFRNEAKYYLEANDTLALVLNNLREGADYQLLIKKTVAGVVLINHAYSSINATALALSGSSGTYYLLRITRYGAVTLVLKE